MALLNAPSETTSLFFIRRGLGVCSTYHLFCGLDQHRNWMRKLFAKKESQNSDNTKPAPQLLDTFLRFWKKDAAVERLTDITVKHSVLELQSGGKNWAKSLTYVLSFYGSKMILDCPNNFGQVPIILDGSDLFWSGPNHFRQVQIIKLCPAKSNLNMTKMIWTWPKQFVFFQNNLDGPKS